MKRIWTRPLPVIVFALGALMVVADAAAIGGRRRAIRRGFWAPPPIVYRPLQSDPAVMPPFIGPPAYTESFSYSSPPVVYSTVTEARGGLMVPTNFSASGTPSADARASVPSRGIEILPDPRAGTIAPLQTTVNSGPVAHP